MIITVKESKKSWVSPDGRVTIWDLKDQDNNPWQTRSQRIGEGINQSFDCTTSVSKSGKTYLIQVPREQRDQQQTLSGSSGGFTSAADTISGTPAAQSTQSATQRFNDAVERFEKAVNNWVEANKNKLTDEDLKRTQEILGGEVVDDL